MKRAFTRSFVSMGVQLVAIWLFGTALTRGLVDQATAIPLSVGLALGLGLASIPWILHERMNWVEPLRQLSDRILAITIDPRRARPIESDLGFLPLLHAIEALAERATRRDAALSPAQSSSSWSGPALIPMTRSGLFEAPSCVFPVNGDAGRSTQWTSTDMVNRLDIVEFRWLDSSPSEQAFFGWSLAELRDKSFLEVVHEDDAHRVRGQFQNALTKGEVHGLVFRVKTAKGRIRAVSLQVATRYGPDQRVSHVRCHLTDITLKLRADRELRHRTRELIEVNARLVDTNRQLEELKERYRDLYQNAPAMYFSLDEEARFIECNDTMLQTLGLERGAMLGRPYVSLLPESHRGLFQSRFQTFLERGVIEVESRWTKADGTVIDVWVRGLALRGEDGRIVRSRSVAQDVTARRRLESELREKNLRLASTNEELLKRNKEMDEFPHVVSHDLQEPLRTLVAFSDFLLADYGDRLDDEGRNYVSYIVDASRRLRALIQDLTRLSRAGKTTKEFRRVHINEVLEIVRADLADRLRSDRAALEVEPDLPDVWGDRDRLGQLFSNLVCNGLKYNKNARPTVEVVLDLSRTDEEWATFAVRDNGIGIDPRYHAKIFQLFRRLHTQDEYEGTGAGLAICTKIINAHGGAIEVESELERGAAFLVRLPRRPGPHEA